MQPQGWFQYNLEIGYFLFTTCVLSLGNVLVGVISGC